MNPDIDNTGNMAPEFVQLTLGRTRMLLPRSELLVLEQSFEAVPEAADGSIGRARLREDTVPVYNLDEQLQLLEQVQDNHSTCVCLGDGNRTLGILYDRAELVSGAGIHTVPLPICMRSVCTPVQALALHGTRILCLTSTERMAGLIEYLRCAGPGS